MSLGKCYYYVLMFFFAYTTMLNNIADIGKELYQALLGCTYIKFHEKHAAIERESTAGIAGS